MKITSSGGTDAGKKRSNNEDAYLLNDELCLYAVADGVGGSEGGEVASRIAVETLAEAMPDLLEEADRTPPPERSSEGVPEFEALHSAVILANQKIRSNRERTPELSNMATTLTMLLFRKKHAYLAHVGDSRAYLLRAGELRQLTNDHSLVAERVRAGVFTPEEARSSLYRHVITRALGIDEEAQPDVTRHAVQKDDRFLLCTDGLTEMLDDEPIRAILAASTSLEAVKELLAAANNAGGLDNITAIVVRITEV